MQNDEKMVGKKALYGQMADTFKTASELKVDLWKAEVAGDQKVEKDLRERLGMSSKEK